MTQTPTQHLTNREARIMARFVFTPTESYYLLNGVKLSEKQLHERYPLAMTVRNPSLRWKGENINPNQKLLQ